MLEKVLTYLDTDLNAMSISLEQPGRLSDANVKRIMRAIGFTDRLRAEITWTGDIEALLPHSSPFVSNFEMDLGSCRTLDDDALGLLLYFANSMNFEEFVIQRYPSSLLDLANRLAKVTFRYFKYFPANTEQLCKLVLA